MKAAELRLTGALNDPGFVDWICHRAYLLDLDGWVAVDGTDHIRILVAGPKPLIDAMEMACSLGPSTVDVTRIETRAVALAAGVTGFQKVDLADMSHNF